jgi:outer membrane protein
MNKRSEKSSNMNKRLLSILVLVLSITNIFAQDSTANTSGFFTLKQCVETAIKYNLQVQQYGFTMEGSKVSLEQAKGNMLPYISGSITHGLSQGRVINPYTNTYVDQNLSSANYALNANVTLWNGSSIQNNIKASSLNYEASKMDWQQQKDNITISVILAYLQVLSNEEQLNAANKQAQTTKKQVERLDILNKDGAIKPSDLYDLKGQFANDELNVITTKNALETSKVALVQLMNVPYSESMELDKINTASELVLYDETTDQIYQQANNTLALVKAAELRRLSAAKTVKAARGYLYPSLYLYGNLGTNYSNAATLEVPGATSDVLTSYYAVDANNNKLSVYEPQTSYTNKVISYGDQWKNNLNTSYGVGLSIPILNGLQSRSRLRQARVTQKLVIVQEQTTKIQLRQNIELAYVNMKTAYDSYLKLSEQVDNFSQSFTAAEARFNAGVGTSVDYLIIKTKVDNATISQITSKYNYILRTKILDFYQGRLTF